jgi:endonuclease YncB( thermonuclease family)
MIRTGSLPLVLGLAAIGLLAATSPALAGPDDAASCSVRTGYAARVVRVSDGDSIQVLQAGQTRCRIRLADIDAPERGQPWSRQSRDVLAGMIAGRDVWVQPVERDRYRRTVARIYLARRPQPALYVNAEMVRQGAAWVFVRHVRDPSKFRLERDARSARRGLWSLPRDETVAPWTWRDRRNAKTDPKQ